MAGACRRPGPMARVRVREEGGHGQGGPPSQGACPLIPEGRGGGLGHDREVLPQPDGGNEVAMNRRAFLTGALAAAAAPLLPELTAPPAAAWAFGFVTGNHGYHDF